MFQWKARLTVLLVTLGLIASAAGFGFRGVGFSWG
jgi:hypothetical protein